MGSQDNESDRVFHLRDLSLDRLLAFAVEEALIQRYEVSGRTVRLFQAQAVFELPPRQAATFLVGMLRGRSWFLDDEVPRARPAASARRTDAGTTADASASVPASAAAPPGQRLGDATSLRTCSVPAGAPSDGDEEAESGRGVEETLDALLAFTLNAGLIHGHEKDEGARRVEIRIPACTSTFSYVDAVTFLFDVVEDELREQRRRSS